MSARSMPLTPGGVLAVRPAGLVVITAAFVALAVAVAGVAMTGPLVDVDGALEGFFLDARHPTLDRVLRSVTELGGGWVVIPVALVSAAAVVRRRPALAVLMLLAVAVRYGVEDVLKEAIGRDRPNAGRIVEASGHSFPSGHVLGAVVGWGLVPAAVLIATGSRRLWRRAVVVWAAVTVAVAISRAYLGVHWFTDTLGSILLGLVILAVVDLAAAAVLRVRSAA